LAVLTRKASTTQKVRAARNAHIGEVVIDGQGYEDCSGDA
jgi:hypothetical protein